jgi:hypothetical protein
MMDWTLVSKKCSKRKGGNGIFWRNDGRQNE